MSYLNSIGAQGAAHLGHVHLGHTEHAAAGKQAQVTQHCPAQDRLGQHATRFRQPNLGGHAQRFAARHGHGRGALRARLNELMEENSLLMKRLKEHENTKGPHETDGEADPVLAERQEAMHKTQEMARLNKMLMQARIIAKIQKDTLDWIMQNLL